MASMIKTLPFAGALVGGLVAMPVISGAATYGIGRVFVRHYENGGDLLNLSPDKVKTYFREQYEAGKTVVTKAVKRKGAPGEVTEVEAEVISSEPATAEAKA